MKQDKAEKIIQKAEKKAAKAAKQVEIIGKKAEAARQRQAAQAEKKAARAADAATKKAAAKTKKAEAAAKKAEAAAKKAEEKKMKALAKVAAKAVKSGDAPEGGEAAAGGKKKGKKKLILLLIPVLAAVIGGAVWFFFLRGGGEEEAAQEPIPIPMEYLLNETPITALPVTGEDVLVYQDEIPPEPPAEPEDAGEAGDGEEKEAAQKDAGTEEEGFTKILYRYEGLQNPVSLISAYTALMTTEDAGFSVVDETLLRVDPPAEYGEKGAVQLARNVPKAEDGTGGGVHSLLLSWEGTGCSVTLDMPEGKVHDPKPEPPAPAAPSRGLADLEALHPSKLGLPGESMESYRLIPQEGSVRIAGSVCMRVNVYSENGQHAGSYFLSGDGKLYQLDENANAVVELDWE